MYNNNDITYFETINKCKELIKNEEKKITNSNFIISAMREKLVDTVKSMYLHYTNIEWGNLYDYIHMNKTEFINKYNNGEKDGAEEYKSAKEKYKLISNIIIYDIIDDTECNYNKRKLVTDHYIFGFHWGYEFIFEVNNIKFILYLPNIKTLNTDNFYDAFEGKYHLSYYESKHCSRTIISSYDLSDLKKAFKEFIENNETIQ